ncbi:uncharacterized protein [Diadema setosum]|uniref:uncharacterized protein n=1 Tax=Diadema setosum TaxID=31175 RepID=UPI003B3BCDD5
MENTCVSFSFLTEVTTRSRTRATTTTAPGTEQTTAVVEETTATPEATTTTQTTVTSITTERPESTTPGYCRKPLDGEDPDTKLRVLLDNVETNLWTEPTSNRKVRVIVKSTDDTSEVTIKVSAVSITTTNGSPPNTVTIGVPPSSDGDVERQFTVEPGEDQPSGMYEFEPLTGLNEVYFDITLPDDYNAADSQLTVTFRGCIETATSMETTVVTTVVTTSVPSSTSKPTTVTEATTTAVTTTTPMGTTKTEETTTLSTTTPAQTTAMETTTLGQSEVTTRSRTRATTTTAPGTEQTTAVVEETTATPEATTTTQTTVTSITTERPESTTPGYCRKPLDGEDPDTKLRVLLDNVETNLWTEPTSNRKVRVIVKSTDDTSEVTIKVSAVSITTTNGSPPNTVTIGVLPSSDGDVERQFTAEPGEDQPSGMYEFEPLTGLNEVYFDITLPDDYNVADSQLTVTFRGCIETATSMETTEVTTVVTTSVPSSTSKPTTVTEATTTAVTTTTPMGTTKTEETTTLFTTTPAQTTAMGTALLLFFYIWINGLSTKKNNNNLVKSF